MGCENSPESIVRSLFEQLTVEQSSFSLQFYCDSETATLIKALRAPVPVTTIVCSSVVTMDDAPLSALRKKKDATLFTALHDLQKGTIHALVSTGNTGALIAGACHFIDKLPEIKRPALTTLLPTKKGTVAVLDVGANVTCDAEMLIQFASLGVSYQKARGIKAPKVGLLNIGTEETKGRPEFREAYTTLEQHQEGFVGNIEGRDVFEGSCDVLVTDGFTGNVLLKTAEGLASFLFQQIEASLTPDDAYTKLEKLTNYAEYPGALVNGLTRPVIKCHGSSDGLAVKNSILGADTLLR